jgi:hypothetical protein
MSGTAINAIPADNRASEISAASATASPRDRTTRWRSATSGANTKARTTPKRMSRRTWRIGESRLKMSWIARSTTTSAPTPTRT